MCRDGAAAAWASVHSDPCVCVWGGGGVIGAPRLCLPREDGCRLHCPLCAALRVWTPKIALLPCCVSLGPHRSQVASHWRG